MRKSGILQPKVKGFDRNARQSFLASCSPMRDFCQKSCRGAARLHECALFFCLFIVDWFKRAIKRLDR